MNANDVANGHASVEGEYMQAMGHGVDPQSRQAEFQAVLMIGEEIVRPGSVDTHIQIGRPIPLKDGKRLVGLTRVYGFISLNPAQLIELSSMCIARLKNLAERE